MANLNDFHSYAERVLKMSRNNLTKKLLQRTKKDLTDVGKIVEQSNKIRETLESEMKELQQTTKVQLEKSAQPNLELEHQVSTLKMQLDFERKVCHKKKRQIDK